MFRRRRIGLVERWANEGIITEQELAAAEMKSLNGPCPRDTVVVRGCSVMKRMVIDYGDLRRRIRSAKDDK